MPDANLPILYSFRRCPYAMRARLAISTAGLICRLREVVLRDKPAAMLEASAKGTVPVLVLPNGDVIDESLDIMRWALEQSDPEVWLPIDDAQLTEMIDLIQCCETEFKPHLDRYKYANRYDGVDPEEHRVKAAVFLNMLQDRLSQNGQLFGTDTALADIAIFPFVRQFANTDRNWFDAQNWPNLRHWLDGHIEAERFQRIMKKYPRWAPGDPEPRFLEPA
ncbi:MAG: glutathione S-transferase [Pseudomonadota bacterium]